MRSINFTKKTWDGRERRKGARRSEDLKKCVFCGVFFSWKSCSPICSLCAHKLIALYQNKGKIVDILA